MAKKVKNVENAKALTIGMTKSRIPPDAILLSSDRMIRAITSATTAAVTINCPIGVFSAFPAFRHTTTILIDVGAKHAPKANDCLKFNLNA